MGLGSQGRVGEEGPQPDRDPRSQADRGERRDPVLVRDAQVVGDAGRCDDPGDPRGQAQGSGQGIRPGAQPVFQEVHDAHDAAGHRLRHVREVHALLDPVPGFLLRRHAGRNVRRQHGGLLRLRRVRGGLPGGELHHDGQRVGVRRQREPVGSVAQGQGRLQGLDDLEDRRQKGHRALARLPVPRAVRERARDEPRGRRCRDHRRHPGRERAAQDRLGRTSAMAVVTQAAPAAHEADKELLISGSEAVAEALTLADLDVVTAYPIRPYDTVMQAIAKKISGGQLVAEYIVAEGEHSQFEIVKHASTVGARVFCGSSGVGWMYAMECLVVTPPLRVPMVALGGNRALDDPGAFGVEHNDALVVRDVGWLLCWIDTSQEALDTTLIAYRVAEDRRVFLPLAISADGAFLTHSQALTMVPPKSKVDQFLPRYNRGDLLLHPDNPITVAPQANEDWVIEIRRQNNEAMARAVTVIEEAYADFRRVFGRGPENPWFEEYMTDDAEVILVGMGTISLPIKVAIREMRAKGKKVGLVRLRWFRPFPTEKLVAALSKASALGIIDRDYSFGSPFGSGVVANEIRAALYNSERRPPLLSFICGLGGREVTLEDVYKATDLCYAAAKAGKSDPKTHWLGVRE